MSIGLTILLALAAWALGPLILRCAGGLLAVCALVLWAIPMQTHTSAAALAFTAVSGVAMWRTGTAWRARRDAARITGPRALTLREVIARGIVRPRRARSRRDERWLADDRSWNSRHREPYGAAPVEVWDEDVIEDVAYDVEPETCSARK
jgi:hypothetical protein